MGSILKINSHVTLWVTVRGQLRWAKPSATDFITLRESSRLYSLVFDVFASFCRIFWMELASLSLTAWMRSWSFPIPVWFRRIKLCDTLTTYPCYTLKWAKRTSAPLSESNETPVAHKTYYSHRNSWCEEKIFRWGRFSTNRSTPGTNPPMYPRLVSHWDCLAETPSKWQLLCLPSSLAPG